jgi:hypothetical protein
MRFLYFLAVIVILVLSFIPFLLESSLFQRRNKLENNKAQSIFKEIPLIDDTKKDRSYVLDVKKDQGVIQTQGEVVDVSHAAITVKIKDSNRTFSVSANSVIECREKYINIPGQKPIPAYMVFMDMINYINILESNRELFVKQGKLYWFNDAYSRISVGSMVIAVSKKNVLDVLMVFECKES